MAYQPVGTDYLGTGGDDNVAASADFLTLPEPAVDGDGNAVAGSDGGEQFDPAIHVGRDKRNADGSYRKKRGRRAGGATGSAGSNRRTATDHKASIESLTRTLLIVHVGIASATKTPEMVLSDIEATGLSTSVANVLEQFDIRPDPKIEAVVGLVMTAGTIYGPRAYMIRERHKKERGQ